MAAPVERVEQPVASRQATSLFTTAGLWLALLIGFAPVLSDLPRVYDEHPWAWVSLLFPALGFWAARVERASVASARWGLLLIVSGLIIELVAVGSHVIRAGRIGLLFALIGFCAWRGLCSRRTGFLLAWAIPLPATAINLLSPWPEHQYGAMLRALFGGASPPLQQLDTLLFVQARELAMLPADGGLPLLVMLLGFVWFGGCISRTEPRDLVRYGLVASLLAVVMQGVILLAGVMAFRSGVAAETVRAGWDLASQGAPVLLGFALVGWMHRGSKATDPGAPL